MKKSLFGFLQLLAVLFMASSTQAQSALQLLGPRLFVNNPSTVQGIKKFTYSYQVSPAWGRNLDTTYVNVPLIRVTDSLACGTITTIFDANQWALIYRGTCEFGAKALAAQTKGAKGVIIVNNLANAPLVNMGAGAQGGNVHIPVLFISKEDGDAINNAIISGNQVKISISRWGFGYTHDLAIVPYSTGLPPYGAIPFSQVNYTDAPAYRNYTGAFIANTGKSTETNIKVKSTTTWTPTGGAASVVHTDSLALAQLALADSFEVLNSTTPYYQTPVTTTGTFTTTYSLSAAATDSFSFDNTVTNSTVVTLNTFSKGRIDAATNQPIVTGSLSYADGHAFTWGPLFFVRRGGNQMQTVQYAVNDGDTSKHSLESFSSAAYIFKWKDGSVDGLKDSLIEAAELTLIAAAAHPFTTADSNGKVFTATVTDLNGAAATFYTQDSSYYWIAVPVTAGSALGVDGNLNYLYRTYYASLSTPKKWDYYAPMFDGDQTSAQFGAITDTLQNLPFIDESESKDPGVLQYFENQNGVVPAVAFNISQYTTSVKEVASSVSYVTVYPTPTTNGTLNIGLSKGSGDFKNMTILDGVGRIVSSKAISYQDGNNYSISTANLASGHYYMNLTNTNGSFVIRQFDVIAK